MITRKISKIYPMLPCQMIREIVHRTIRERNENDTIAAIPAPDRAIPFPSFCLFLRIVSKGGPLFPLAHCSHSQGKERRVSGEAFRSRAFAFAPGWRTVKNKDPFVRIGVEKKREREKGGGGGGGLRLVSKGVGRWARGKGEGV